MALHRRDVLLVVAIVTERNHVLLQQRLFIGRVRIVARGAVIRDVVRELCLLQKVVMAIPAERRALSGQQVFVGAGVRLVARETIPVTTG